ncbi:MAG TPA: FMN-binding protein [Clostridiaceae bacterium]|nr:FMN-binding protein [Clostridiaceae bacterium]
MKLVLKILAVVALVVVAVFAGGVFFINRGLDEGSKVVINRVDLSLVEDGTYNGKYQAGRFSNEVSVTVQNHKITGISILKDVLFKKDEVTKELFERVMEKQNTDVDVISGATVTCKAYLKSVEDALSK